MQEVSVRIRFSRPCLGACMRREKRRVTFVFERDAAQRILFLPGRWTALFVRAARLANQCHSLVRSIAWCPTIVGTPRSDDFPRKTSATATGNRTVTLTYLHEQFGPGDTADIMAELPDGMSLENFRELLSLVGKHWGFSPFGTTTDRFGTFDVVTVQPRRRQRQLDTEVTTVKN